MLTASDLENARVAAEELGWVIESHNYANAVVTHEFDSQFAQLFNFLSQAKFSFEDSVIKRGGGQTDQVSNLTSKFISVGWRKVNVTISNRISFSSGEPDLIRLNTSHEIDHLIKSAEGKFCALEIEWNNKDEFFDRDIQAFNRLYGEGVIDLGVILTRGPELEDFIRGEVYKYFKKWGVFSRKDFKNIRDHLKTKYRAERFSYPTDRQELYIQKVVNQGKKSYLEASAELFVSDKYSGTTTNWRQLNSRVARMDISRTPLLFIGIPPSVFDVEK